jgi:hypothetical protein
MTVVVMAASLVDKRVATMADPMAETSVVLMADLTVD